MLVWHNNINALLLQRVYLALTPVALRAIAYHI